MNEAQQQQPVSADADFRWIAIFVSLVILEGSCGKWISSNLEFPPVLLRDFLGFILIWRAWRSGRLNQYPNVLNPLIIWSLAIAIFSFIQALFSNLSILIIVIGLRFWLLYLWVTFAICCTLSSRDFNRLCDYLLLTLFGMLPLLFAQNFAAPDAWINKATYDDTEIFLVGADIVRVTGTFSFTLGFTCYLALLSPLLLGESNAQTTTIWFKRGPTLVIVLVLCAVISGSRAAMTFAAVMIALSLGIGLLIPGRHSAATITSAITAITILILLPVLLPDTIAAVEDRFWSANVQEDPIERLRSVFIGSASAWDRFSIGGEGIGLSANMTSKFLDRGSSGVFLLAEAEPERVLLAGGIFGLLWLAMKAGFSACGLFMGLRASVRGGGVRPFLLWVTAAYALISWPMSGQLAAQSIGSIAIALAAASVGFVDKTRI